MRDGTRARQLTTGRREGAHRSATARPAAKTNMAGARIDPEVTRERFVRLDAQHVELRPESTNPEHRTIAVDLARTELHIDGIAVGALIGQGFSPVAAESAA